MVILFSGILFLVGIGFLYVAFLLILLNIFLRVLYAILWIVAWMLKKVLTPKQEPEIIISLVETEDYVVYMKDVTPRSRLLS